MKVIRTDSLTELLRKVSRHLSHWLVLEESGQTLTSLYRQVPALEYEWLFLETPYADFLKRSPVVLRVNNAMSGMLQAFSQDPRKGISPGIVVASQASEEEVLVHLRRCLSVAFYGDRKGMLRYYHPDVAAALFGSPEHVSQAWFGPLERWIWHGEAHPRMSAASAWHALCADDDESAPHEAPGHTARTQAAATPAVALSRGQEAALERHIRVMRPGRSSISPARVLTNRKLTVVFLPVPT
ncbi:DUF4123 domain-containing protein [Halomonas sp. BC04]|uniref:DUF4123 domain-containing protein n=1 Tax=Halomonas sp. BC04 TaxID=1403540 RepID=UPI0003ED8A7A|nr:DUF4123 domain-containing protein [Halomonas sp. BC04]EWH00057.1 hypothetical protein Q427_21355 [Halomonas sp. BC04]